MGGKNGKIWQQSGNGWQDGRQKRQGCDGLRPCYGRVQATMPAAAIQRARLFASLYVVVQGAADAGWRRGNRTKIPL